MPPSRDGSTCAKRDQRQNQKIRTSMANIEKKRKEKAGPSELGMTSKVKSKCARSGQARVPQWRGSRFPKMRPRTANRDAVLLDAVLEFVGQQLEAVRHAGLDGDGFRKPGYGVRIHGMVVDRVEPSLEGGIFSFFCLFFFFVFVLVS